MFTETYNAALSIVVDSEDMDLSILLTLTDSDFLPVAKAYFPIYAPTEVIVNVITTRYVDLPTEELAQVIENIKFQIALLTVLNGSTFVCQN